MRPFMLPSTVDRHLDDVVTFWNELRRGENEIPFWDDLHPAALPRKSAMIMILDAFERPQRFRFVMVAPELAQHYGEALADRFANEIDARFPLDYIASQCSATAESRAPAYYEQAASGGQDGPRGYARILLPLWGEGSVRMLLGATAWLDAGPAAQAQR